LRQEGREKSTPRGRKREEVPAPFTLFQVGKKKKKKKGGERARLLCTTTSRKGKNLADTIKVKEKEEPAPSPYYPADRSWENPA